MERGFGIDKTDEQLLGELDLAARSSVATLSARLLLSKATAANRIRRLEEKGVIAGYSTVINFAKLGYTGFAVYIQLSAVDEANNKKINAYLRDHPRVYWVAQLCGDFDLVFSIYARDVVEFNQILSQIQRRLHPFIRHADVSPRIEVIRFGKKYLMRKPRVGAAYRVGQKPEAITLSVLDNKVITELSRNCRLSTTELAKRVQVPRETVRNRVRKLEEEGVIQGYLGLLHPEKIGYQSYLLLISVYVFDVQAQKLFYQFAAKHPHVSYLKYCIGLWDIELVVDVRTTAQLQEILSQLRNEFRDVISKIDTVIIFDFFLSYGIKL